MIKLKSFLKKTRTGKVLKIVREHYLRDDIGCGSEACNDCTELMEQDENRQNSSLSASPISLSSLFSEPHYVVLDTNIILNQIDILEVSAKEGGFQNVIVLQTVLEEVRHRSSPIYKRLTAPWPVTSSSRAWPGSRAFTTNRCRQSRHSPNPLRRSLHMRFEVLILDV